MKQLIVFKALLVAMVMAIPAYVSANEGQQSEEAARAQCEAEAQNAANPEEYVAQCIEEKIQAQKEQAEDGKDAS